MRRHFACLTMTSGLAPNPLASPMASTVLGACAVDAGADTATAETVAGPELPPSFGDSCVNVYGRFLKALGLDGVTT